ncbi:MAG: glutamine amidotransferase [Elusimicrobiota bacterium]|nr:glutamine amidotransferase [Elusimicrobiota bacterium]
MTLGLEGVSGAGAAVAAVAAAATAFHFSRAGYGRASAALRAGAAAAVVLAVLAPQVSLRRAARAKPRLLVALDAASSMKARGAGKGTRLEQGVAWLERHRADLEARAEVSVVALSERARPVGGLDGLAEVEPSSETLRLEEALAEAASGPAPARVWLLTDGTSDAAEPGRALAVAGAPVDLLGVGPSRRDPGAAFLDLRAPDFAYLHGPVPVEATVEASGVAGRVVTVTLQRADESAPGGWRVVDRRERRPLGDLETFGSTFTVRAERLGTERFRLLAESGGRSRAREFRVEVVRQKYRIMFLAGRPSPEYAFLREFLKADPNRELVSFVILRNPENPAPAPDRELSLIPFPADEIFGRALPQFDLFILENFSAARFRLPPQYLDALKRFVAGGGALLVMGGESAFSAGGYRGSPLEELLPVALSGREPDFVPGLFAPRAAAFTHPLLRLDETPEGSARAWEALPPLDGWGRFAATRPGATVLASHPSERADDGSPLPVVAVRPYGRGKVMLVSTDSTWRWRLGAAGDRLAAGAYGRFWGRAIAYLTGNLDLSKVKFAPVPDRLPAREPAVFPLRVFDEGFGPAPEAETRVEANWTDPSGRSRVFSPRPTGPGAYALELTGLAAGAHRLRVSATVRGRPWGSDEARFVWEPATDRPMDRAWLGRAAAAAGGTFVDLSEEGPDRLLERLPAAREESEVVRRLKPFDTGAWLALAAALLLLEWAWRRRRGHA